jgi:hypothetical protein
MLWDIPYSTNNNVIQALKSVKNPGNTFDLNPKWSGTLPSLIYLSWDIYRNLPHPHKKN